MKTPSLLKKLGRFCWRREKFLGLGTGHLFGVPIYKKELAQDGIKRSLFGICYSRKSLIQQCIASSTERKGLRRALLAYRRRPDFPQKFDALVRGLPPRGRTTVARILNRITHPKACRYSPQEQQEIQNVMFDFRQCVFQVSDEVCYYNGSYLPAQTNLVVSVLYYKHGLDQLRHLERIAQRDIVDVGGYHGDSVLVLAPRTTRTVYTFEPIKENCALIEKTLQMNHISNCKIANLALGSQCQIHDGMEEQTLDAYVAKHGLNVGLIKVDIEGAEPEFLKGAKKTICTQKPVLLLSIYHNWHDFFELKPIIESWNLGYRFDIYKPTDGGVRVDTLLIAEVD
jgi:hypothetical protein